MEKLEINIEISLTAQDITHGDITTNLMTHQIGHQVYE